MVVAVGLLGHHLPDWPTDVGGVIYIAGGFVDVAPIEGDVYGW